VGDAMLLTFWSSLLAYAGALLLAVPGG